MHWRTINIFEKTLMQPLTSPIYLACIITASILTSWVLLRIFGPLENDIRNSPIDGMRGYLALFVFCHHTVIWYQFKQTGIWAPTTGIYENIAKTGVRLFFMITAYLFTSKLLSQPEQKIDWSQLFLSRVFRLTPLYFFVISLVISTIIVQSDFSINTSIFSILKNILHWLGFCIFDSPTINGFPETVRITSGTTWTLKYEWLFYFSLPLISLFTQKRAQLKYVILATVSLITYSLAPHEPLMFPTAFACGILVAIFARHPLIMRFSKSIFGSALLGIILLFSVFKSANHLFLSCIMLLAASGCHFFNILNTKASKFLGTISYSIYLLHGILLYFCYHKLATNETPRFMSFAIRAMIITPLLIILSRLTFTHIEKPFMNPTSRTILLANGKKTIRRLFTKITRRVLPEI
ncbi:MAG: hypothetical protein RL173_1166 [Fibrobacterota bacterium]